MAGSITEKLKNIGPGALVAAGFVGPGTVTTCTVSGASYGYTMLWALLFAFVWFTYRTPHLPLFLDPVSGCYGVQVPC